MSEISISEKADYFRIVLCEFSLCEVQLIRVCKVHNNMQI